jgi:hypothetical protein
MKTKIFLLMLIAVALFSCQKEKSDPVTEQEVTFTATLIDPGAGLKNTNDWDWKCDETLEPVYAVIDLLLPDGLTTVTYKPLVFRLDGKLYTQAIKLLPGVYTVTKFLVMDDMGTPGEADDEIYMATPEEFAPYSQYTNPDIRFEFLVEAFKKAEVQVEVLCFIPAEYTGFGFNWFVITEIIIREQCFFGDLCVKHLADYEDSHYELQPGGLKIDMPAIMRIDVYKGGVFVESFTNDVAPNYGVGSAVCVQYADVLGVTDVFTFELWIMVKQGNAFPFVLFKTLTFNDIWNIEDGADNVYDFVLGNCNLTDPDLQLAPWQNLPVSANVTIAHPGVLTNTYWDVRFNSYTPAGVYDLPPVVTPWMGGWCGDALTFITPGTFNANIYSSLRDENWPAPVPPGDGMPCTLSELATVNWLMNHLHDYGYDLLNNTGGEAGPVQQAIWKLINNTYNVTTPDPLAVTMYTAASTQTSFVPLPGGWAAVLIVKDNNPDLYQLIFVVVDP